MRKWWHCHFSSFINTVYIKKSGQFFFHTCSLTCLNKDTSVLLKVINISISSNYKNNGINFCKDAMDIYVHNPFNKVIKSLWRKNALRTPSHACILYNCICACILPHTCWKSPERAWILFFLLYIIIKLDFIVI